MVQKPYLSSTAAAGKCLTDDGFDEQVARARRELAQMQANLARMKEEKAAMEQHVLETASVQAFLNEQLAGLQGKLADTARKRDEDLKSLIYSSEGWGSWEIDFRATWQPFASEPDLPTTVLGGPRGFVRRPIHIAELLGVTRTERPPADDAVLLCENPLMVMVQDFATVGECAGLIELGFRTCKPHNTEAQEAQKPAMQRAVGSGGPVRGVATASLTSRDLPSTDDRVLLERMQRRVAAFTGVAEHETEIRPFLKFDQPGEGSCNRGRDEDDMSIGLHVDINGGVEHCVCSVIVYLNSCDGGRTVFPCVGDDRSRRMAEQLTRAGHTHTSHSSVHEAGLGPCAAELVQRAEVSRDALRIQPRRGTAVLFFTLLGEESSLGVADCPPACDPWSWHGGAAVTGDHGKWTLQIFKEVPPQHRGGAKEAAYIATLRRRILAAAQASLSLSAMD
eukprot:TRINITY_DN62339_c0_g1_i1.p1 TRINITY_DN62339_c0_g1~~TRINITY_DN62339_c0_g1_i1.p1  ORF type:complete len:450 (-),score=73.11 TRINITY_DN62339_c0_g1_i1:3-1352(-)